MKKAAILILIVGLALTIITSITFFTREKVVDLGTLEITSSKRHHIDWNPLWGVGVMVLGGILFLTSPKK